MDRFDALLETFAGGLIVLFLMMAFAWIATIVAARFLPWPRARIVGLLLVALIALPILAPGRLMLGAALLAALGVLNWQLSLPNDSSD